MTHAYAHAHFSNERVIAKLRIVSCPGGGVSVAVTREFERDNCVTSEILQSDWTIPNRAGVPRKSTKVSFVRESREGLGPRLTNVREEVRHSIYDVTKSMTSLTPLTMSKSAPPMVYKLLANSSEQVRYGICEVIAP